ncbi:MAG: hypothetical protein QOI51_132 [Nocardioidaceae bacterium]|nr:hypothetical protein [Nocardioidaceae bacterium]MDX6307744.1 hypothetical protein [Nocardioidaceae bacterium]
MTALLAVDAGHPFGTGVLVTSAVFTGQLSIGWSNDLIDVGRDRMVHRADKPLATGALQQSTLRVALSAAVVACVVLSLLCGLSSGLTHLVLGVGSGWAYNLGLKRTLMSWLPYAVAFGTLPAVVWLALDPPVLPPAWLMAGGALLGVGAHLVNVLPDLSDDAATGVRGLPHWLGRSRAQALASVVLVAASSVVVFGPGSAPPVWTLVALAVTIGLACVGLRWSGGAAFRATIAIAAVDVLLMIAR